MPAHILMATWAGGGNVQPALAIGARLAERGHEVRVLGPESLRAHVASHGLGFVTSTGTPAHGVFDSVATEAKAATTDLLFVDYMLPEAFLVGEHCGIKTCAFVHTLYEEMLSGDFSPMDAMADRGKVNELRGRLGLKQVARVAELVDASDAVIVATVPEFDKPTQLPPANVHYIGPLVEPAGPHESWTAPWTPDSSPRVLVSMSTTPMDEAPVIQRVLDALAKMAVHALVTAAPHVETSELSVPSNCTISPYVRHAAVLPHIDLVVSHGGLSTIGAALSFGRPMLCLPLGREQPNNARRVESLGAGRVLDKHAPAGDIREAVNDLLSSRRYAEAAATIQTTIAEYGNGERAVAVIEGTLA